MQSQQLDQLQVLNDLQRMLDLLEKLHNNPDDEIIQLTTDDLRHAYHDGARAAIESVRVMLNDYLQ